MDNFYRDLQGEPEQGILDMSATQKYPLGTRFAKNDGRVFRYTKAGATLIAGDLIQSAALQGALTTVQSDLTPAVAAAGALEVTAAIKTTEQPKDTFKDGWMAVTDGDAANAMGDLYLIKSHPLSATNIVLTLHEPLKRAITVTSRLGLLGNIYKDVIQAPITTPTGCIVGVCPTVVTDNYYFWLQTWGICNVLVLNALAAGLAVARDKTAAGSAGAYEDIDTAGTAGADIPEIIGMSGWTVDTSDSGFVFLTIAP